jgi:hypothetical protein
MNDHLLFDLFKYYLSAINNIKIINIYFSTVSNLNVHKDDQNSQCRAY